jgi:hypothetical protein
VATALNVIGTALWRLRRKIERKPAPSAEHFLKDMVAHDLRALLRPTPDATIRAIGVSSETSLQTSVD